MFKQIPDKLIRWMLQSSEKKRGAGGDSGNALSSATAEAFSGDSYNYYRQLTAEHSKNFLLLDVKSLPRSGLHHLKKVLSGILGDHFSFCEWYQEPGCCRKMPCSNTSYVRYAADKHVFRIRMTKSHDFATTDRAYPTSETLRRLVLIREPIYQLTSWFALDELNRNRALLAEDGIKMQKIWLKHEPEVVARAYALLDASYQAPTKDFLERWVGKKGKYVEAFMLKWIEPSHTKPHCLNTEVVFYDDLPVYIRRLLERIDGNLQHEARLKIAKYIENQGAQFRMRSHPFEVGSERISQFIAANSDLFQRENERLMPLFDKARLLSQIRDR